MIIDNTNMWDIYQHYDAICCTTNRNITKFDELVMGAGIAKEFVERYPFLKKEWGKRVKRNIGTNNTFFISKEIREPYLCYFATKDDWKENSSIALILNSMILLCFAIEIFCWDKVLLPKPGCNNGRLSWDNQVYPAIKSRLDQYPQIDIISR